MKKIIDMELHFGDDNSVNELVKDPTLKKFIMEHSLNFIKYSLSKKLKNINVFNVVNLNLKVGIEYNQYKNILNNILKYYEGEEDYIKCNEILKLIKKL